MIKKLICALILSGLGVGIALADDATINTPKSDKGQEVHPFYGGYKHKRVTASTTETMICSKPCVLAEIYMTTGANASLLTLRDTGTADAGGTVVLNVLHFLADTATARESIIHRPLRMVHGLSAAVSAINQGESVDIAYLEEIQ